MPRQHGAFASAQEAILDAAAQLFTEQGVHGTSLFDIAERAGLSKGTLYYYYPAKEELVMSVAAVCLDTITDQLFSWVDELDRETPVRQALLSLTNGIVSDRRNASLYVALQSEGGAIPALGQLLRERQERWVVMLEVGTLRSGSRGAQLMGESARMYFLMLSGYILQSVRGGLEVGVESIIDALLRA